MNTYFIRHSEACDIGSELRNRLWKERTICIHYEDKPSSNPDDYSSQSAKHALGVLNDIAQNGGYICATMHPHTGCLVGLINPGTAIKPQKGPKQTDPRKLSTVKTLQLADAREVPSHKANRLLIGQPQQGTLRPWKIVGDRVRQFVEFGEVKITQLGDLLPFEQEVMCSEFLRTAAAEIAALPRMMHLSAPVGRTRKAVDVAGVTADGTPILVQVTHLVIGSKETTEKANALREIGQDCNAHLIMFCRCKSAATKNGVHFYPLEHVFDAMKEMLAWRAAIGIQELPT